MPDLWFLAGLAMGVVVTGFAAIGSFDRGADSARLAPWRRELSARKNVVRAHQPLAAQTTRADQRVAS